MCACVCVCVRVCAHASIGVTGRCDWEECKGARYPPAPGVDHTVPKFEIAANDTYILDYYDLSPVVDTPGKSALDVA